MKRHLIILFLFLPISFHVKPLIASVNISAHDYRLRSNAAGEFSSQNPDKAFKQKSQKKALKVLLKEFRRKIKQENRKTNRQDAHVLANRSITHASESFQWALFPIVGLVLSLLAISSGAKALEIINRNPDKYDEAILERAKKGKRRGYWGLLTNILTLGIWIAVILLLSAYFGG